MLESLDFYILDLIQNLKCPFLDFIIPRVTALGNGGMTWILMSLIMCINKKYRKTGITVLAALLAGFIICNIIIKPLAARPRPCWIDTSVPILINVPSDYSFPSGHTLSSFIAAFILLFSGNRFRYAAVVLASLIAFSRLYLYVHFPSDVLGGIFLAALIAYVVLGVSNKKFRIRKNNKK